MTNYRKSDRFWIFRHLASFPGDTCSLLRAQIEQRKERSFHSANNRQGVVFTLLEERLLVIKLPFMMNFPASGRRHSLVVCMRCGKIFGGISCVNWETLASDEIRV